MTHDEAGYSIHTQGLNLWYGDFQALKGIDVDIRSTCVTALIGPSGCGKTTLLRMISGLETPTEGQIIIGGQDMAFTPPNLRPTNMVFQSYAVFPHMTVEQNVGYGLKVPEQDVDDFAGLDLKGKIAVIFAGSPAPMAAALARTSSR